MVYHHIPTGGIVMGGSALVEYRRRAGPPGRRVSFSSIEGQRVGDDGRLVELLQVVDREQDRYRKRVVDVVTGEVLRDVEKPLSEHQGRGTARGR